MRKATIFLSVILGSSMLLCACGQNQKAQPEVSETSILGKQISKGVEYTTDTIKEKASTAVNDVLQKAYTVEGEDSVEKEETDKEASGFGEDSENSEEEDEASEDEKSGKARAKPGTNQQSLIDYEGIKSTFQSVLKLGDEEAGISLKSAKAAYDVLRMANEMGISALDDDVATDLINSCLDAFSQNEKETIIKKIRRCHLS